VPGRTDPTAFTHKHGEPAAGRRPSRDLAASRFVLCGGQSGNPCSAELRRPVPPVAIRRRDPAAVDRGHDPSREAKHTLRLLPEKVVRLDVVSGSITRSLRPTPLRSHPRRLPPLHSLQHWPGMAGKLPPVAAEQARPVRPRQARRGRSERAGAGFRNRALGGCVLAASLGLSSEGKRNIDHVRTIEKSAARSGPAAGLSTFI